PEAAPSRPDDPRGRIVGRGTSRSGRDPRRRRAASAGKSGLPSWILRNPEDRSGTSPPVFGCLAGSTPTRMGGSVPSNPPSPHSLQPARSLPATRRNPRYWRRRGATTDRGAAASPSSPRISVVLGDRLFDSNRLPPERPRA